MICPETHGKSETWPQCDQCGGFHERISCECAQFEREEQPANHFAECDAWVCICGNTASRDGFYPCDQSGKEVEPDKDWTSGLYVCGGCGRIIQQTTGLVVGFKNPCGCDMEERCELHGTFAFAVDAAQDAFWAEIVKNYPHVTSGDFPPCATFAFDAACREALKTWLHYNDPKPQQDEPEEPTDDQDEEEEPEPQEPKAWQRYDLNTNADGTVEGEASTNDNRDHGYPNEYSSWPVKYKSREDALRITGGCHIGCSGIEVEVMLDGEPLRKEDGSTGRA